MKQDEESDWVNNSTKQLAPLVRSSSRWIYHLGACQRYVTSRRAAVTSPSLYEIIHTHSASLCNDLPAKSKRKLFVNARNRTENGTEKANCEQDSSWWWEFEQHFCICIAREPTICERILENNFFVWRRIISVCRFFILCCFQLLFKSSNECINFKKILKINDTKVDILI